MTKKNKLFAKVIEYFKSITVGNSEFNYAVTYGLFSIIAILIKQVFTFITHNEEEIINPQNYIVVGILNIALLISLLIIFIKKLGPKNKFAYFFMKLYPFIFVVLGTVVVSMYLNYNDKVISFIVLMVILFWIQIYKLLRRVMIFLFAASSYILLSYFTYGISEMFYQDITLALMLSLIVGIASTIIYQLHSGHKRVIHDLDLKNKRFSVVIDNLRAAHTSLKISKKITDNMYELTQEVLKNENIEDVLQLVLEKAAALIPNFQAGSILLLDNNELKFVAASGYKLEKLQEVKLKPEETFQSDLENKYDPFIIKNLEVFDEAKMGKEKADKLLKENVFTIKACMTCSFKYNDEFFGSINIDNFDSQEAFVNEDKYLIKQLAQEIEIIISIHKLYEQALRPTKYDDLTQAKTRRYCIRLLEDLIKGDKDSKISICTIDINNLKTVNDEYGHDIGDKYLFEFAEAVRKSRILENIFGRVGGDEFLLIFSKIDKQEALKQISIIKNYLKKNLLEVTNKKIEISFASGIAVYGVDGKEISGLIKLSDKRMYEDKYAQKQIVKIR